jgi:hypothetical protein
MTSAVYQLSPVNTYTYFTTPTNVNVGYLMYNAFLSTGAGPLGAAIDSFRLAGVTELILDMRYNGGGSTLQARNLASMILCTIPRQRQIPCRQFCPKFQHYPGLVCLHHRSARTATHRYYARDHFDGRWHRIGQ